MARRSIGIRCTVVVASGLIAFSPPAHAEPVDMAPQHYSKATRDGWNLNISIEGERINSVPNLGAAANSREAFVTLLATATATAGTTPITDSAFITGYQLGCQTDVSNGLQTGVGGAFGPSASLGAPLANPMGAAGNLGIAGGVSGFVEPSSSLGRQTVWKTSTATRHPTSFQT